MGNKVDSIIMANTLIANPTSSLHSIRPDDMLEDQDVKNIIKNDANRNIQTLKMLFIMALPVGFLFVISSVSLQNANSLNIQLRNAEESLKEAIQKSFLIGHLQKERGLSAMYLSSDRHNAVTDQLSYIYGVVDNTILNMVQKQLFFSINLYDLGYIYPTTTSNLSTLIMNHRLYVIRGQVSLNDNIMFYTTINKALIERMSSDIVLPRGDQIWKTFVSITSLLSSSDAIGIQRALGSSYYASCVISTTNTRWFIMLDTVAKSQMETATKYNQIFKTIVEDKLRNISSLLVNLTDMRQEISDSSYDTICSNMSQEENVAKSGIWWDSITLNINIILELITYETEEISTVLANMSLSTKDELILNTSIMVIVLVGTLILGSWYVRSINKMTGSLGKYVNKMTVNTKELSVEKKKSEKLLLQMLPKSIAEQLKNNQGVTAEYYESATVYFSDIVDFTNISAMCSPHQTVDLLNALYSKFDCIIEKYDVYKVETIGDSYMVASGLPQRNGIQHVKHVADMSLELLRSSIGLCAPTHPTISLKLRVGLHSGPVAAGVVGISMPRYCLFGDTVNTASRMQTTGKAMKIHISPATRTLLIELGGFVIETRGTILVKGKGEMTTFWLLKN